MEQCFELVGGDIIADFWNDYEPKPTVIAGDLQDCVPAGWFRKGEGGFGTRYDHNGARQFGGVQHMMATDDFDHIETLTLPMTWDFDADGPEKPAYVTDHPALFSRLTRPRTSGPGTPLTPWAAHGQSPQRALNLAAQSALT